MKQLENWFLYDNLVTNTEKTKVMLFQGNKSGSTIKPILHFRRVGGENLGIHITQSLKSMF